MGADRWTPQDLAEYQARMKPVVSAFQAAGVPLHRFASALKDLGGACYKSELLLQLNLARIPVEPEFKIFEHRKFRADWRVKDTRILIEFEGGLFAKGKQGHSSVSGILRDIEKYNMCAIDGWTVIRVAPNHVSNGQALKWIQEAIASHTHGNLT